MNKRSTVKNQVAYLAVLALVWIAAGAGCGSSSTSSTEADTVAAAEGKFLRTWRQAEEAATRKCSHKTHGRDCYVAIVGPRQEMAMAEFTKFIRELLDQGLGPDCTDRLEEALYTMNSVPFFPGESAAVCRAESQK
jgi:hypothetical protein